MNGLVTRWRSKLRSRKALLRAAIRRKAPRSLIALRRRQVAAADRVLRRHGFRRSMLNGCPGNITRRIKRTIVRAQSWDLTVRATTNGNHARESWHRVIPLRNLLGRAVDLTGDADDMLAFQFLEYERFLRGEPYLEIIGPNNNLIVLNGRKTALYEGHPLEQQHDGHVHIAR